MAAHRFNPADLLKTYPAAELERIASSCHEKNSDSVRIPVDIDLLLEQMPGVDLDCWPALKANHGLLGMAGMAENDMLVVYVDDTLMDSDASERLYRMTLAEELAHVILHREAIEAIGEPSDFLAMHNHPRWYEFERNAKRLAAALLMPAPNIIQDSQTFYAKMMSQWPNDKPLPHLELAMNVLKGHLADRYVVSVPSMGYRLTEWPIKVNERIQNSLSEGLSFME